MANRIKGITIQLDADATPLQKALKGVDSSLKSTQGSLKDVNKLLKLDPGNVELLRQKQELLGKAVKDSKTRLEELNKALKQMESAPNAQETIDQQNALKREIIATEQSLEDYEKQLKNCNPALESFATKSGEVAEKTKAISGAAAGLAGALIGNAVASASAADDLNTLSQQTGFTVEELQKMKYASDVVDVSMEQMTGSVMKMTKTLSSSPQKFEELGVAIYDANGNMRDTNAIWYDTLDALSQVENETERDALSMEIFGKSAMDMAGIVDDGGQALKELGNEAEGLGLIMSQDMVDGANKVQDSIDLMKARTEQAFLMMGSALAETLVPAFEKVLEAVTNVVTWFANLDGGTQKVILIVAGLIAAISPLAALFSQITTIISGVSAAISFLVSPVGLVIAGIAALIAVGVLLYKNWDTIKEKTTEIWGKVKEEFQKIVDFFREKIDWLVDKFNAIKDAIKNAFSFSGIKDKVSGFFGSIGSLFGGSGGFGSGGFASGGMMSGSIVLNNTFTINTNNVSEAMVNRWADIITDRVNENLGRMI